jgi:hypothetical protein
MAKPDPGQTPHRLFPIAGSSTLATTQGADLFVADADGGNVRQLTFDGHDHGLPAVCDSGRAVVSSTNFDGIDHLWKLDLQSGASTKLTNGLRENNTPCQGNSHPLIKTEQLWASWSLQLPVRQEGAEIKPADTLSDSAHGVRWTPDSRSLAAMDIRSGTPISGAGFLRTVRRSR